MWFFSVRCKWKTLGAAAFVFSSWMVSAVAAEADDAAMPVRKGASKKSADTAKSKATSTPKKDQTGKSKAVTGGTTAKSTASSEKQKSTSAKATPKPRSSKS